MGNLEIVSVRRDSLSAQISTFFILSIESLFARSKWRNARNLELLEHKRIHYQPYARQLLFLSYKPHFRVSSIIRLSIPYWEGSQKYDLVAIWHSRENPNTVLTTYKAVSVPSLSTFTLHMNTPACSLLLNLSSCVELRSLVKLLVNL